MADLIPLARQIQGVFNDAARDRLPPGSVWEMTDWVPTILQAGARMRGAWKWQSPPLTNPPDGMIFAPFRISPGARLLVANGTLLTDVPMASVGPLGNVPGTIVQAVQNPIFHRDRVIVPAGDGVSAARFITWNGAAFVNAAGPTGDSPNGAYGKYACLFKDRVVLANTNAQPSGVNFSQVGDPTLNWNLKSQIFTSYPITGLAQQRQQVLCFHDSTIERIKGTTPPDSTLATPTGDMSLDFLFDRAGCYDARSIAYYQDNVLFADSRGIWLTDGSLVRNVSEQGGAVNLWYRTFARPGPPLSIASVVYRNYYLCTVRHSGQPPITFVVEIPTRRIFTLGNIDSRCYAFSIGTVEKLFGTDQKSAKVSDLTPVFNPDATVLQVDDDGTAVLPVISTGWSMIDGKVGYKRVIEAHVSYQVTRSDNNECWQMSYVNTPTGADKSLLQLRPTNGYVRRPVAIRKRMEGIAIKIVQTIPTQDSRLFDISLRAYPEEQNKT